MLYTLNKKDGIQEWFIWSFYTHLEHLLYNVQKFALEQKAPVIGVKDVHNLLIKNQLYKEYSHRNKYKKRNRKQCKRSNF